MRAVRYHGPEQPLHLEDVPRPSAGPGEVLVKVTAAGICCHTELHFLTGLLNLGVAPLTLGHEVVGWVESTGPGVSAPQPGDRVIVLVYGVGTVAFGLIQLAKVSGAEVIAISRTSAKLDKARALGAAHVLNANDGGVAAMPFFRLFFSPRPAPW